MPPPPPPQKKKKKKSLQLVDKYTFMLLYHLLFKSINFRNIKHKSTVPIKKSGRLFQHILSNTNGLIYIKC